MIKTYMFQLVNRNILHCRNGSQWTKSYGRDFGELGNSNRIIVIDKIINELLQNKWEVQNKFEKIST